MATWQDIEEVTDFRQLANVPDNVSIALQSQYAHSQRFRNIGTVLNANIDVSGQIDEIFRDIMDPQTAKGIYLDWWGARIGVQRQVKISGNYVTLNDDYFRFLLYYRALSNISDTTAFTVNNLLSLLIDLPCYVHDDLDMTFKIYIMGNPTPLQRTIIKEYGLLNRPAGVMLTGIIVYSEPGEMFGFFGSGMHPFNQAPFNSSEDLLNE